MAKYPRTPSGIRGNLEITKRRSGIFIGGDPEGLRSLARLLTFLADADQEAHPNMPDGERVHVHLYPAPTAITPQLTPNSVATELSRLDAKGTGAFPGDDDRKRTKRIKVQPRE